MFKSVLYNNQQWVTLKTLDETADCTKGNAFKVFKLIAPQYVEQVDYLVLDAARHGELFAQWQSEGLLYASSVRGILLNELMAQAVLNNLNAPI